MALLATLLFILLSPGVLLTLPPVGKQIFASGKMSLLAVAVHALVFSVALYLLKGSSYAGSYEGFQGMPPLPSWLQSQTNNMMIYARPDTLPPQKSGIIFPALPDNNFLNKYKIGPNSDFVAISDPRSMFSLVNEAINQKVTKAEFTTRIANFKNKASAGLNNINTMRNDVKADLDGQYNFFKSKRDALNKIADHLVANYDKLMREPGPFAGPSASPPPTSGEQMPQPSTIGGPAGTGPSF